MTRPTPDPYQIDGALFLALRQRAVLTDETGLGKTAQAIMAAQAVGAASALVVCPAIAKPGWTTDLERWNRVPCAVPFMLWTYDYAARLGAPQNFSPDVLILDEAQRLKTPGAQRTRAIYGTDLDLRDGLAKGARHRWLLSATPTTLHAGEWYTHLRALFPDVLTRLFGGIPDADQFTDWICETEDTPYGRRVKGDKPDAVARLNLALKPFVLGRDKVKVRPELKRPLYLDLTLTPTAPGVVPAATVQPGDYLTDDEFLHALSVDAGDGELSPMHELGLAKARAFQVWLQDWLGDNPGRKIIVFAHHLGAIDILANWLAGLGVRFVQITGQSNALNRTGAIHQFQNVPEVRVFLGQTRAANTAATLTAADTVVLLEPDPSPAENYQAIGRADRIGQTRPVTAYFVGLTGSGLDLRRARVLRQRAVDFRARHGTEMPIT